MVRRTIDGRHVVRSEEITRERRPGPLDEPISNFHTCNRSAVTSSFLLKRKSHPGLAIRIGSFHETVHEPKKGAYTYVYVKEITGKTMILPGLGETWTCAAAKRRESDKSGQRPAVTRTAKTKDAHTNRAQRR